MPATVASRPAGPPIVPDETKVWPEARLRFLSALWGEGFVGPGGAEEALRLSKPLGLQSSHSLLNVGAGLGGAARSITSASGAWVSAFEQDPDLAAVGAGLSKKMQLEKKAEVKAFDPAAPKFRSSYYHHALVQEALWMVEKKDVVVAALSAAVKEAGQVVITDLTMGETPILPEDETARTWRELDRSPIHLMQPEDETRLLAGHGLDIRIAEDISARHVQQAVSSWRAIAEMISEQNLTRSQARAIVNEAELWLRRLALLRTGRLRLMRWHAIKR